MKMTIMIAKTFRTVLPTFRINKNLNKNAESIEVDGNEKYQETTNENLSILETFFVKLLDFEANLDLFL